MAKTSTVRVDHSLLKQLRTFSQKDGRSLTWLLNKAIEKFLATEAPKQ